MSKAREIAELGDALTVDGSGNIDVTGTVTATSLAGDGTSITGNPTFGTVTATSYAGDGSALTGIAGGGTEFISNTVISSGASEVVFTGFDSSLYESYIFTFSNLRLTSDNRSVWFDMSVNGGSTWEGYAYLLSSITQGGVSNEHGGSGILQVYSPNSLLRTGYTTSYVYFNTAGNIVASDLHDFTITSTNQNAIKFYPSSGTFLSGTISMYGMKKS